MSESRQRLFIGVWLLTCAALVFSMIVVGGMTRLTQSGLSMVEWDPIMGIIPPLSLAEWDRVFQLHRTSPEYQLINAGMSLAEFKVIFWWEYGHRVLGRLIGLAYFLPLLFFTFKGWVPKGWSLKLGLLFVLGGLQGLMGWYMVQSGLVDVPRVSQYRLVAHLGLALIIFCLLFWYALDFLRTETRTEHRSMARGSTVLRVSAAAVCVILLMMLSGGFVAGTKAGFIINTFPTMNGQWLPDGLFALQPLWRNYFENAVAVQFTHRVLALVVAAVIVWCVVLAHKEKLATSHALLALALVLQITLGILALIYRVPLWLGAGHQACAVLLLATSLLVAHRLRKSDHQPA